jgi:hypothetical protein
VSLSFDNNCELSLESIPPDMNYECRNKYCGTDDYEDEEHDLLEGVQGREVYGI